MEIAKSLQQVQPSYIREILDAASAPDVISLAGGLPHPSSFPVELMRDTFHQLPDMPKVFQYTNTAGYTPLLDHLNQRYQLPASHQAVVTTGSQQGLDLIARAYIDPGDTVVMETPSYLGAMQVFGLVQAHIVTVNQNSDGPVLDELEACFKASNPKLFYAVPDFSNPTGISWSLTTRQAVAELCIRYNVTLVEDAPYRELRFAGDMLPMASDFCPEHALVLRSYSKIASPGLRIGVVTGLSDYIAPLIKVKQGADLHSSVPMQAVLLGLLEHKDFDLHLLRIRALYRECYESMAAALDAYLPEYCSYNKVDGGMFVWLEIPECDTFELAKTLLDEKVAVVPSAVFYPKHSKVKAALRLNYTNASAEEFEVAIQRISQVIRRNAETCVA